MKKFRQLKYEDRLLLEQLLRKRLTKKEIAKALNTCVSTVYNEIKRGEYKQ